MLRHQTGGRACKQHTTGVQDAAADGIDQCALFDHQEATVSTTEAPYDSTAVSAKSSGLHNQTNSYGRLGVAGGVDKHRHKHKT